jgi:hypothetical protein
MRKTRTRSHRNKNTRKICSSQPTSMTKIGGMNNQTIEEKRDLCILESPLISSDPNTDPSYRHIGLIHFTDSAGINLVRGFFTDVANIFGKKGFDNTIYDGLRKSTLEQIQKMLKPNQKVCSCRMEFDMAPTNTMIFHHFYGTLYEKNGSSDKEITSVPPAPESTNVSNNGS